MKAFFQGFRGGSPAAAMRGPRTAAAARVAPEVRSKVRRSIGFMVGSLAGGGLSGPVFRILRSRFTFNEALGQFVDVNTHQISRRRRKLAVLATIKLFRQ